MKLAWFALVFSLLGGCAALQSSPSPQQSWRDAAYEDVVKSWGAPTRSTRLQEGRAVHTWVSEGVTAGSTVYPSLGVFGGSGLGVGVGTSITTGPGGYERVQCERTLIFKNDRVEEQKWRGPADFCRQFRRPPETEQPEAKQ